MGHSRILLARAVGDEQESRVGNQTGGRVFLFLYTDDFWRDYEAYKRSEDRGALDTPDVPFQMLTALDLGPEAWKAIARKAPWHAP